jgi:hypothetical protein
MIDLARYVVFSKINGKASMEGMSASSLGHVHLDRLNDIVDVAHNLDVDSGTSSAQPARHICRAKEYNQHLVTTPFIDKARRSHNAWSPPTALFPTLSWPQRPSRGYSFSYPRAASALCPSLHLLKSKMSSTVEVPEEQMAVEEGNNLASEEGNNLASGN